MRAYASVVAEQVEIKEAWGDSMTRRWWFCLGRVVIPPTVLRTWQIPRVSSSSTILPGQVIQPEVVWFFWIHRSSLLLFAGCTMWR